MVHIKKTLKKMYIYIYMLPSNWCELQNRVYNYIWGLKYT